LSCRDSDEDFQGKASEKGKQEPCGRGLAFNRCACLPKWTLHFLRRALAPSHGERAFGENQEAMMRFMKGSPMHGQAGTAHRDKKPFKQPQAHN